MAKSAEKSAQTTSSKIINRFWVSRGSCAARIPATGRGLVHLLNPIRLVAGLMRVCAALAGLLLLVSALPGTQCPAATITVERNGEVAFVTVSGTLVPEDGQAFADKVSGVPKAVVFLSSPGGSLGAGLRIGTLIRLKNYITA